jgi:TPR repeat protein
MDDISGKKFSLQDWVMKRAANQSGAVSSPFSARYDMSDQEFGEETMSAETQVELKAVSNGSAVQISAIPQDDAQEDDASAPKEFMNKDVIRERAAPSMSPAATAPAAPAQPAPTSNPIQQLQIVRLLTDLGDRLRQSEKEREVLWKELEICRSQIAEMGGREGKVEKSYIALEAQMDQREVFVKELLQKQIGLEERLKEQLVTLDQSKREQEKFQDKINSIETATGSAIVRVEDALAENAKLAKRVEQLSQDKARLMHKLEAVEETLTQTQDTLKAKALVFLTDMSLAAQTNLPHTPAWTGDDTLKVRAAPAAAATVQKESGPIADLAASLRPPKVAKMRASTAILVGLVLLGVIGGVISSQFVSFSDRFTLNSDGAASDEGEVTVDDGSVPDEMLEPLSDIKLDKEPPVALEKAKIAEKPVTKTEVKSSQSQDELMAQAAKIANKIEPSNAPAMDEDGASDAMASQDLKNKADSDVVGSGDAVSEKDVADGVLPPDFESAQAAQDKAVADFKDYKADGSVSARIKSDKSLPKIVAGIEAKALAGDANAQHDLAAIYTAGHAGVKVNYSLAAKWFNEAAHGGIVNAQYNLAVLYHQGLGVPKDVVKAIELYRVAASNSHPEAQYNLAIAYVEGVGVEYNPQIASVYFEQAASGGIVEAAYNLGLLHENGLLGESQPDEAVFWYTLAANKGNKDAVKALKQLKTQLSMSDEDALHIAQKVAAQKPGFLDMTGKPALPEQKAAVQKSIPTTPPPAPQKVGAASKADAVVVSQIQEQLGRLGMYKGDADGAMSAALGSAIKSYQQKNGLKVDGVASDDVLVHMLAADVQNKQIISALDNN